MFMANNSGILESFSAPRIRHRDSSSYVTKQRNNKHINNIANSMGPSLTNNKENNQTFLSYIQYEP